MSLRNLVTLYTQTDWKLNSKRNFIDVNCKPMKIILSEEQKEKLEEQHKTERDSRICDRIKAVLLANITRAGLKSK